MLLFQRAVVEGSLSIAMQCSKYVDLIKVLPDEEKEKYHLLLDILTPVVKSYPSEMGILSISQGLQCLGGSGYCDDYPLELYFRDSRIHPIHEGTTGIQAMDLLGRKVIMQNGQAFMLYVDELQKAVSSAKKFGGLGDEAEQLNEALVRLQEVTKYLLEVAKNKGPEYFLADATLYLEFFGIIAIAWQWLLQGIAIQKALHDGAKKADQNFYQGKMFALRYFYRYELPKTMGLAKRLMDNDGLVVDMTTGLFND
jgi:butyryl-CoA dehydrogenase